MNQFYDDTTKTLRYVGQSKQELLAIPDIESVRHIVIDGKIEIIPGDLFRDKSFYDVETIEFAEDGDLKIIERKAFQKFGKLKAIRFPDSLKTIGEHAFSRCHLLTSIELPVNGDLEEIQRWAFCNCARYIKDETEFISIHIPKSVKKIGRGAFTIRPLKRIDFAPDCQLETIDETTFTKCENLESILIPACVKKIKKGAFSHCKSLKTIKFTDDSKLEEIHEEAFCNTGLESIEIPMLVTQIRLRAFSNCESLASITFAENSKLVYLPLEAFDGRMKPIPPPSCPFFDEKEFKYEGKSYDLTKNPFEFDEQALTIFRRFPVFGNIQHATFNQSIQEIPDDSFKEVCSLISIEIPSSVQIIGKNAFRECKSLVTVRFASDHDCNLEEIDDFAFYSCTNLVSIDFPSSLKIIGTGVFESCSSLATARFADDSNLKDVEHKAFRSCKDLWNMRIPKAAAIREDNSVKDCALKESQYRSRYDALPVHKLLYSSIVPDNGDGIGQILKELKILGKKKDFELVDDLSGMTPLHLYASLPAGSINMEVLKCLLNMGPDTWLERQDKRGRLPIHYACMVGESNLSIIELLSSKLDVFKRDNDGYMPLMLGIRFNKLNSDAKTLLYKSQPISPLMGSGVEETKRLKNLKEEYIDWITKAGSIKKDSFSPHLQHGWVTFLIKCLDDDDDSDAKKMAELNRVDVDSLRLLATAKDKLGREAIKVAPPTIKKALQKILLFLGRYDLVEGEPIHQSATCVVIRAKDAKMEDNYKKIFKKYKKDSFLDQENFGKALQFLMIISDELDKQDNPLLKQYFEFTDATKKGKISENEFIGFCMKEGGSEVALKLMKNKDEYERELSTRESLMIANCIVPVLTSHDSEHDSEDEVNIKESLTRHIKKYLPKDENENPNANPEEYCHVLVMPFGDRDLDTIFRSEMRRDPIKVRDYAKQIAQLLRKLHDCGLVHGDLKMHNVVRIKSRLRLIDLDASASIHHRIGSKFSSGVVPPEMIYCLTDDNEEEQILKYYEDADDEHKKKRAPKNVGDEHNKRGYIVRSFSVKREDSLPYDICIAKKSMDVWAFGVMLYNMCTLKSLFPVNLDDDITEGEDLKKLHEWRTFCMRVNDHNAKRLLEQILQRTPEDRYDGRNSWRCFFSNE
jgi:serine/threonine protein kinase